MIENERVDLFTYDAVCEIVEAAFKGEVPRVYRMEWDEGAQANVISGVARWEAAPKKDAA